MKKFTSPVHFGKRSIWPIDHLGSLLLLAFMIIGFKSAPRQFVDAAKTQPPAQVLLVYDGINAAAAGDQKIQALQRSLTGLNRRTKTVALADYRKQALLNENYQAVIVLINWPQKDASKHYQAFWQDLERFSGRQLFIGGQPPQSFQNHFSGTWQRVTHRQFILADDQTANQQLLTTLDEWHVLMATAPTTAIGQLQSQETVGGDFAFGAVQGKYAYLPFYTPSGLTSLLADRLLAIWLLNAAQSFRPLLTITEVTPMSSFKYLKKLALYLQREDIPFAISATSVQVNTELPEFRRYTKVLRTVEDAGGIIYLQVPYIYTSLPDQLPVLKSVLAQQLTALTKEAVYPIGISAPSFWNQDKVYQQGGLKRASDVLLLPDPTTISYQQYTKTSTTFKQARTALTIDSLLTIKQQGRFDLEKLNFAVPTALTLELPTNQNKYEKAIKKIEAVNHQLFDPRQADWQPQLKYGKHVISYQRGQYLLDGKTQEIVVPLTTQTATKKKKGATGELNQFFKVQGHILMVFLGIILLILLFFLIRGRRVYWAKYRRQTKNKNK